MLKELKWTMMLIAAAIPILGCSKGKARSEASAAPPVAPAPKSGVRSPLHQCPAGSTGDGTLSKPCMATGANRMMHVTWTGKIGEKGASFRVVNRSPSAILYGNISVYFYGKAGDQLQGVLTSYTTNSEEHSYSRSASVDRIGSKKTTLTTSFLVSYLHCSGNLFGGALKPGEETVIMADCVKEENVPKGTTAIEGEMSTVGFADPSEKNVDYYWGNRDLIPEKRQKGGVK